MKIKLLLNISKQVEISKIRKQKTKKSENEFKWRKKEIGNYFSFIYLFFFNLWLCQIII